MNGVFVTLLATENFLPGVLALNLSLKKYNKNYPLEVMVTSSVSQDAIDMLSDAGCKVRLVEPITNPDDKTADERGFNHTYTKLRVFGLAEYDRLVFLDSDMLVCGNIEELFQKPAFSAVAAGALMQGNNDWAGLNTGLMVVEPSGALFNSLSARVGKLPSVDGSDQGFLQSYLPDWNKNTDLHLPHTYNVPWPYLGHYCANHGFHFSYKRRRLVTNVSVLHYWGPTKPWMMSPKQYKRSTDNVLDAAILLWWDTIAEALA